MKIDKERKIYAKVKKVFGKRYGREISDQEAKEIVMNLAEFMEACLKRPSMV